MVGGLAVVGHQLSDPCRHPVLDARDLARDLVAVRVPRPVALALPPQPGVLVAKRRHGAAHLAIHAQGVLRARCRDLLAALAAEDEQTAHLTSVTTALLSSRRRAGSISKTESGRPAAAHTTAKARRSRSMNTGRSVPCPNGGTPPIE